MINKRAVCVLQNDFLVNRVYGFHYQEKWGFLGVTVWLVHHQHWCTSVESRSALDQNTSWVIVGYPRWRFIRTRSLVNWLSFLRNEQVVPDGFESLYERFTTRRDQSKGIDESDKASNEVNWARKKRSLHIGRPTRARDKTAVTIPTVWVKPSSCARDFTGHFLLFCFHPSHNRYPYFAKWRRRSVCSLDRVHLEA